ncbi:hypothetical protein [Mongoliibacter ruber]|nr:hypothetical protein [Mongoliibacter ruber]
MAFSSCHDFEHVANESLIGKWEVNEAVITFGPSNGQDSVWRFEGDLGSFLFDQEFVTYQYALDEFEQYGESSYVLTSDKERAGFAQIRKWRLQLLESEYEIEFDDGTRRSHQNASEMTMINQEIKVVPDVHSTIILHLTKN